MILTSPLEGSRTCTYHHLHSCIGMAVPTLHEMDYLDRALHFSSNKGLGFQICLVLAAVLQGREKKALDNPVVVSIRARIWRDDTLWSNLRNDRVSDFVPEKSKLDVRWKPRSSKNTIIASLFIPYGDPPQTNSSLPMKLGSTGMLNPKSKDRLGRPDLEVDRILDAWDTVKTQTFDPTYAPGEARDSSSDQPQGTARWPEGATQEYLQSEGPTGHLHSRSRRSGRPSLTNSLASIGPRGSPSDSLSGRQRAARWGRSALETAHAATSRISPSFTRSPRRHFDSSPRSKADSSDSSTPPPNYADSVRDPSAHRSPLHHVASALSISNRLRTPPRRHATVLSRNTLDSPSSDSSGVVCPSLNTSSTTANQPESSLSKGHPRRIPVSYTHLTLPTKRIV